LEITYLYTEQAEVLNQNSGLFYSRFFQIIANFEEHNAGGWNSRSPIHRSLS